MSVGTGRGWGHSALPLLRGSGVHHDSPCTPASLSWQAEQANDLRRVVTAGGGKHISLPALIPGK